MNATHQPPDAKSHGPSIQSIIGRTFLSGAYAGLSIDASVVPGQQIPITLFFFCINPALDLGTGCVAKVFLGSDLILQSPNDGTFLPYVPSSLRVDIGEVHASIQPPPPFSTLGGKLYSLGQRLLRLEITTNGKDRGPFTSEDLLNVIPEKVSQYWWKWEGDLLRGAAWKEQYSLAGSCENWSQYVRMNFDVRLEETDDNGNTKEYPGFSVDVDSEQQAGQPRESEVEVFAPITQDWPWLVSGVWAISGSIGREFGYAAKLLLHDSYGNEYPAVLSTQLSVVVNVSDSKVALSQSAFAANATAVGLGIGAIFLPWLAAPAAAAAIAAAVLGDQALDPPKPNLSFLQQVLPRPIKLPKGLEKDDRLAAFRAFFEELASVLGLMIALGETESRLLGARGERNQDGIEVQTRTYKQLMSELVAKTSKMAELAEGVVGDLRAESFFSSPQLKSFVSKGIALQSRKTLTYLKKLGISKLAITTIVKELRNARLRRLLLSTEGIAAAFRAVSLSVVTAVKIMKNDSEPILRASKV